MALKHQNNLRRRPRSWVSALPSMATGTLDIACPGGEGTGEQVLNAREQETCPPLTPMFLAACCSGETNCGNAVESALMVSIKENRKAV